MINDNEITSQFLIGHYAEVFSTKLIVIRVKKDLIENVSLVTNFLSYPAIIVMVENTTTTFYI